MEHEREEESREMFSPNESGEYMPHRDTVSFTVQGLRDALTAAESNVTEPSHPTDEFVFSTRSNNGGLTQKATPTRLLMEWRYGAA